MWELIHALVKENGPVWILVIVLLADKLGIINKTWKYFKWKKEKEEPQHQHRRFEDTEGDSSIRAKIESLQRGNDLGASRQAQLENTMDKIVLPHIETGTEVRVKIGVMENDIKNLKENQNRTEANVEKIFNLISNMKDAMIEMGYGQK